VKISSLYSRIGPANHEDSVREVRRKLLPILAKAREAGGFVNLDMETYSLKEITLDVLAETLDDPAFREWEHAGVALQAYLKCAERDLRRLIGWAKERNRRITIRLVKGAYWEYETIVARQKGWEIPVFPRKSHTDANFERCVEIAMENHEHVTLAVGSHNVRSIAKALETAERLKVPRDRYEFQMLYGMAEPIKRALMKMGFPVREYAPIGELLPGMAYLVRRLLENASNEGFLQRAFLGNVPPEELLAEPESYVEAPRDREAEGMKPFSNEPVADFTIRGTRTASVARRRRGELAAWQVREVGKSWLEADADVAEAIDYLEYYGREMVRLGKAARLGDTPGEENLYLYRPRGVGLRIVEKAGRTAQGQKSIKRTVVEMGGKNAILIDADADLDQAIPAVVSSAFGYQGQKCSACSRVIVHADCYDRFLARLCEAVKGLTVGPPQDPANGIGPVIDAAVKERILAAIELGRREGKVAAEIPVPGEGYYVSPTVLTDLPPDSEILREEIFGPVLAVIRARDIEEAVGLANSSDYALTGGLFSRSPATIRRVGETFEVGNLYINRGITGAVVGRQPFGGFRMSGVGSKAGGPDYLLQFMEPRVITENTMRRGFSPDVLP